MDDFDHRRLGNKLDLWHVQDDAPGMVFWHPRGYAICRVLEDYMRRKMQRLGYAEVRTPQLLPRELWVHSGHWEKFGENMLSLGVAADGERNMALKPMSCQATCRSSTKVFAPGATFQSVMLNSVLVTETSRPALCMASC